MVEWKKLGDVCDFQNGFAFKSGLFKSEGVPIIRITNITSNNIDMTDCKFFAFDDYIKFNLNPFVVESGDILLAMSGATTGKIGVYRENEKAYLNQRVGKFVPHKTELDNRYLYHFLLSKTSAIYIMAGGGAQPNLSSNKLMEELRLPIPSINQQENIAKTLDTFTSSIDNLKQQIAQRRKQFNWLLDKFYYSDKYELLNAVQKGEVEVKSFDEIGTFTRGRRFVRTDIVEEGVPCIHYGDMYTYYGVSADETPTHLTKEKAAKLRFASKGDVVIVGAGENDIDIGVGVAWLGEENVVVHDACFIYKHNVDTKYISYFTRSMNYHLQIRMGVVDGKICSISAKELGRTLIPIRTQDEQSRIVFTLDTLEASIQNLETQLSQREKQYEYYRNKLLTFED